VRFLVALADVRRALAVRGDDDDTPTSLMGVRSIDSLSHDRPPSFIVLMKDGRELEVVDRAGRGSPREPTFR
jgi:hypothetical protein